LEVNGGEKPAPAGPSYAGVIPIMSLYEKEWQDVGSRIARAAQNAGRDPAAVTLLAVSKGFPAAAVRAAYALGQRAFGENYVQEALSKMEELADLEGIEWHLIGPLQSNKTRPAAGAFAWIQSVDHIRTAGRLAAAREAHLSPLNVCVQVNVSAESSKSGVAPDEALGLAREVARLPQLRLRGLMGIAAVDAPAARQHEQFRQLRGLFDAARVEHPALDTLSMGMSGDLDAAIAEGATLVRVGTALFGTRSVRYEHGERPK
jgi:pyridoxal phosphate enzyme (YggS family)